MSLVPLSSFFDDCGPFSSFILTSANPASDAQNQGKRISTRPWPRMDLIQTNDTINAVVELPGVERKDVEIHHDPIKSKITISGTITRSNEPEDAVLIQHERVTGTYSKTFSVPHGTKDQDIKPTLENGLLRIVCPRKTEKSEARKIEIA